MRVLIAVLLAALTGTQALGSPGDSAPQVPAAASIARFIVKLRPAEPGTGQQAEPERIQALAAREGLALVEVRHIVSGMHLVRVQLAAGSESAAQTLARLRADREVEFAEPDERRHVSAMPNDPLYSSQWYLQSTEPAAVDAADAWTVTTGSPGLVIADLDTGVRFDHPDLRNSSANRLLPGYNLISDPTVANNVYGRGPDASDPGDWVTVTELQSPPFNSDSGCTVSNSSWHGTRVTGVLGAITDNDLGIAGIIWQGWIEPVRVLGKCGGYDSDIIAGMAWAAGNAVSGVPDNPYPARILNMSLGATGSCPASYQQMVDQLLAEGVLVVVSAGNEGGPVDAPANCIGAAGVAGLRHIGTKVGYSSLGPEIALSAPAGNCVNTGAGQPCLFSIETTTNSGTTIPATNTYTNQYNYNVGTSFAAPQVAGTAGLMLAVNANLTPGQLIARLQAGATTPFPVNPAVPTCHVPMSATDIQDSECNCTPDTCGAGMANAKGAVLQALRPIAAVKVPVAYASGSTVVLDGSGSSAACNATLANFAWTVVQPATNPPTIMNADSARASIVAPRAPALYTLELTVTDNHGRIDQAQVIVQASSASSTAPASAGGNACLAPVFYSMAYPESSGNSASGGGDSGGGGGGAIDVELLLVLAGLVRSATRRHSSRCAASSHGRWARR